MDNYSTKIKSLGDILRSRWLHIPAYQRPYQWDSENIETLLNDLIEPFIQNVLQYSKSNQDMKLDTEHDGWNNKPTFLGSIILTENEVNVEDKLWNTDTNPAVSIVDGQQRTITFHLIIYALIYKTYELEDRLNSIDDVHFKGSLTPKFANCIQSVREKLLDVVGIDIKNKLPGWKNSEPTENTDKAISETVEVNEWYHSAEKTNRLFREEDKPKENIFKSELSAFLQIFAYQNNKKIEYKDKENHIKSIKSLVGDVARQANKDNANFNIELLEDNFIENYKTIIYGFDSVLFENHRKELKKFFLDKETIDRFFSEYCKYLKCDMLDYIKDGEKESIQNYFKNEKFTNEIMDFFILETFSAHLLREVHLSEIICKSQDMSLEIFTSLNTTGTDLTVLETFKPQCYKAAQAMTSDKEKVVDSDIIQKFNKIQTTYLEGDKNDSFKKIPKIKHMAEISRLIKSFMHYYHNKEQLMRITGSDREQRNFLRESLDKEKKYKDKVKFVNEIWKLADFKRRHWNIVISSRSKNTLGKVSSLSDEAFFYLRMLKECKFELTIPIIHKFYQDYERTKNSKAGEDGDNPKNILNDNIITLALFTLLYRITFSDTGGIDNHYRSLMKDLDLNIDSKATTKNSELRKYLSEILERKGDKSQSRAGNNMEEGFTIWYEHFKDRDLYKGNTNKFFVKVINRVAAKYGVASDEGSLTFSNNYSEGEDIKFNDLYNHKLKSIEHLVPSSLINTFQPEDQKWLHSIGNLSTLPESVNSSYSDRCAKHKELLFQAYTLKKDHPMKNKIKQTLADEGVNMTDKIVGIIEGKSPSCQKSDYTTHIALSKKVPETIDDIKVRGKEISRVFFEAAISKVWPE